MSAFNETLHPRGQASNAGQFREKSNDAPAGTLATAATDDMHAAWEPAPIRIAAGTNPWIAGTKGEPIDLIDATSDMAIQPDNVCDGCWNSPVPGAIPGMDTNEGIQRCDECGLFDGDLAAAEALRAAIAAHTDRYGKVLQVAFEREPVETPAPVPQAHVSLRTDGRYEVADTLDGDKQFGCQEDEWCILAKGHAGDCNEDREVWPGPNQGYETTNDAATLRTAMLYKEDGGGSILAMRERIQGARDTLLCTCGHQNVSHGYGDVETVKTVWPDRSLIGSGACGVEPCTCPTFDLAPPAA